MDFYEDNDSDLAAMEEQLLAEHAEQQRAQVEANTSREQRTAMMLAPPPPIPLYDPAQVPVLPSLGTSTAPESFFQKKLGPLPVWAWLLGGGALAGGGYWWWRSQKGSESDASEAPEPKFGERVPMGRNFSEPSEPPKAWEPSRSGFVQKLQAYFDKKGLTPHVTVWHDAEDARDKGKMRILSPLVNVQVTDPKTVKVDTALQRFARREGLDPRMHQDGSIGFYPHTGKRGKEWEEYIDNLRDDGQSI